MHMFENQSHMAAATPRARPCPAPLLRAAGHASTSSIRCKEKKTRQSVYQAYEQGNNGPPPHPAPVPAVPAPSPARCFQWPLSFPTSAGCPPPLSHTRRRPPPLPPPPAAVALPTSGILVSGSSGGDGEGEGPRATAVITASRLLCTLHHQLAGKFYSPIGGTFITWEVEARRPCAQRGRQRASPRIDRLHIQAHSQFRLV